MLDFHKFYPLMDAEPETGGGTAEPDGQETPEAQQPTEKMLSQSEVNAIIAREKKKAEKAAREALEAERKQAEMTEADKAKAEREELTKQLEAERAARTTAERRASLTGKVADVTAALKLLDDSHLNEDGSINDTALLKSYPFLAPAKPSVGGSTRPANDDGKAPLSLSDFDGKSTEWINANWHRLKQ